ncbi:hypothetical protein [Segetibacter koreensis]|uniref:hypothetical protein n=1 Tax=Segetibacter koreensis TaxID=398037 RepID=UPI00035FD5D3|nr:hypothetical protein [Segetibacter koreensis]
MKQFSEKVATGRKISYYAPNDNKKAQILVTDMKGRVLRAYSVARGECQVNIKSQELPTGTYNYTFCVNGSKIDTKQMIITK